MFNPWNNSFYSEISQKKNKGDLQSWMKCNNLRWNGDWNRKFAFVILGFFRKVWINRIQLFFLVHNLFIHLIVRWLVFNWLIFKHAIIFLFLHFTEIQNVELTSHMCQKLNRIPRMVYCINNKRNLMNTNLKKINSPSRCFSYNLPSCIGQYKWLTSSR